MKLQQVFEKTGIDYSSVEDVDKSLASLEFEDLLGMTDELLTEPVEFSGDDNTQSMVIRYALLNAFSQEHDSLSKDDFEIATQRVQELSNITTSKPEPSVKTDSATPATPAKPVKNTESRIKRAESKAQYEALKQFITDNPSVVRADFIEMMVEKYPRFSAGTIGQYFYTIRKELDLESNGERGRPKNNTKDQVSEIIQRMQGDDPKDIKAAISNELNLTEKTAVVYYCRIKKELGV